MQLVKKVKYKGWNCNLYKSYYEYGNGVALHLVDAGDGEPVATCTVNVGIHLGDNEVCIKNYSEGEGMLEFLIQEGVVANTGRLVQSGYVTIPICRLLV